MEKIKVGEKIQRFCSKYLVLVVAILTFIIGFFSIFVTAYFENATYKFPSEKTAYRFDNGIVIIFLTLLSLITLWGFSKLVKKIKSKWMFLGVVILTGIIQFFWIFSIRFMPYADQENVIVCAKQLLHGEFREFSMPGSYFGIYPFQIGIIYYIALVFRMFSTENFLILQALNVIFSLLNMFLMLKITKQLFKKEDVQKILNILLLFFSIYFMFFNVHVYGNINGLTFGLVALYFTLKYLEKRKKRYLVIIAVSIAISIALKSNYNIFLCGIVLTLMLDFIKEKKLMTVLGVVGIIFAYLIVQSGLKLSLENTIDAKVPEGIPMIGYIYMGMHSSETMSSGWYSSVPVDTFQKNGFDEQKTSEEDKQLIKNRVNELIKNPKELVLFYIDKFASTWLNPTFQAIWCSYPGAQMNLHEDYANQIEGKKLVKSMLSGKAYKIEESVLNIFQVIVFIFAGFGMIKIFKSGKIEFILLPMIFLGGFVFHAFWETKAIYVLQYYYLLLPFAAYGIYEFFDILGHIKYIKRLPENSKEDYKGENN